jgi:hypothetical protein
LGKECVPFLKGEELPGFYQFVLSGKDDSTDLILIIGKDVLFILAG